MPSKEKSSEAFELVWNKPPRIQPARAPFTPLRHTARWSAPAQAGMIMAQLRCSRAFSQSLGVGSRCSESMASLGMLGLVPWSSSREDAGFATLDFEYVFVKQVYLGYPSIYPSRQSDSERRRARAPGSPLAKPARLRAPPAACAPRFSARGLAAPPMYYIHI